MILKDMPKPSHISNTELEKIFSMLKIQTKFCSKLANDSICARQNNVVLCFEYHPDKNVLKIAKSGSMS